MEHYGNVNEFQLPQSDDKNKIVSSQVLEYYKKYSQNRELPKYFCGSSSGFKIEDWHVVPVSKRDNTQNCSEVAVNTEEIYEEATSVYQTGGRPPLIGQDHLYEPSTIPTVNVIAGSTCPTSPASSIASNRKLEWDNGADIGYRNVETHRTLQKSISLPVLSTVEYVELQKNLMRLSPEGYNIESSQLQAKPSSSDSDLVDNETNTKQSVLFKLPYSSSTSESVKSLKTNYASSSSSTYPLQKHYSSDSETSSEAQKPEEEDLQFLKRKVGLPLAESTPISQVDQKNTELFPQTPQLTKPRNIKSTNLKTYQNLQVDNNIEILNVEQKLSNSCDNLSSAKIEEHLKKWPSQIDINMVDQISHYKNMKIFKLCISKPIVVECIGVADTQIGKNKFIQTSLPRNASVAVQTDFKFSGTQALSGQLQGSAKLVNRQSVVYVCHSDSSNEQNTQSSATQTNSNVLSNCNSFEYLYGAEYDQNLQKPSKEVNNAQETETAIIDTYLLGNLKRCPPKSDLTSVTPDSEIIMLSSESLPSSTSKESPLAQLRASKQSGHLVPDLENNLQLLQNVIKSKKYDDVTKKYCVKKIVEKMVDCKYTDDSSGSYNTDQNQNKKIDKRFIRKSSDKKTYKSDETSASDDQNNLYKMYLHDNKPWLPIQKNTQVTKIPRKLQTQTFVNEILPNSIDCADVQIPTSSISQEPICQKNANFVTPRDIHDRNTRLQRNPLFTLTDNGLSLVEKAAETNKKDKGDSSNSTTNDLYEELQPMTSLSNSSSLKENMSDGKNEILHSWRENKTRSEQILEQKSDRNIGDFTPPIHENKDDLVRFTRNERKHQLYWINNEILHLNKLKQLLEQEQKTKYVKGDTDNKSLCRILQKPHIEDIKGHKKSTTVYVVTTEKSKSSSNYSTCNSKHCRNSRCQGNCSNSVSSKSERAGVGVSTSRVESVKIPEEQREIYKSKAAQENKSICCCKCNKPLNSCKCETLTMSVRPPSLVGCGETIVGIDNENINLKNARLMSSEQFTTDNSDGKCRTSIRRYTVEIPVEGTKNTLNDGKISPCSLPKQLIQIHEKNDNPMSQKSSSPTPTSRLTHEIITSDEIVSSQPSGARSPSCSPTRKCLCSPKRKVDCKCNLDNKKTQTTKSLGTSSSITCTSSSSELLISTESSATHMCCCCKQHYVKVCTTPSFEVDNRKYILCVPCYNQSVRTNCTGTMPYYTVPGHVCTCYNAVPQEIIQQMRNTIQELDNLEKDENYCKCMYAKGQPSSGYCLRCKCKRRIKNRKGGLAYIVTLESDETKHRKHKIKKPVLEEITIKVPSPRRKSKVCYKSIDSSEDFGKENLRSQTKNYCSYHKKHDKCRKTKATLQEYLCMNKPDFIASAEQRRQCLLDLAYMREERCQKYKQLLALTSGIPCFPNKVNACETKKPHLFSSKEVKEMAAKKYKKLPEVQQKLLNNKEKQIKKANKLLADIFNNKLRQQVLQGKHTLPMDASVINLV